LVFILALAAIGCGIVASGKSLTAAESGFALTMFVLLALCITAGKYVKGRSDGILIDERNRISLSRLQWVMWFLLIISAYYADSLFNLANGKPFPVINQNLLILLGLSSGTAVLSNVVTKSKMAPSQDHPDVVPAQAGEPGKSGALSVKATPDEASWADLYKGEEVSNDSVVDISRLQKLVLTILLGVAFFFLLWKQFVPGVSKHELALPDLDEKFLWLLGISQAAYIAAKSTPKPNDPPPTVQGVAKAKALKVAAAATLAPTTTATATPAPKPPTP
jgi:hypothetical protein